MVSERFGLTGDGASPTKPLIVAAPTVSISRTTSSITNINRRRECISGVLMCGVGASTATRSIWWVGDDEAEVPKKFAQRQNVVIAGPTIICIHGSTDNEQRTTPSAASNSLQMP
jgi:hypothetical protein